MENTEAKKIQKIKKSSRVTVKVLNVVKVILAVGLVLCLIGGICCLFIKTDDGTKIEMFGQTVTLHGPIDMDTIENTKGFDMVDALNIKDPMTRASANCFAAAGVIICSLIVVLILKKTFMELAESDTPFNKDVLKRIKVTGIILTVISALSSGGIAVVIALSFWCIYCIFDYGIELQKNADETL